MSKEIVLEVNSFVIKGSVEDFYRILSCSDFPNVASNGNVVSNGNGVIRPNKVVGGLQSLKREYPDIYPEYIEWVVNTRERDIQPKEICKLSLSEWNVELQADRVCYIMNKYS
jgi:hypothetical protein